MSAGLSGLLFVALIFVQFLLVVRCTEFVPYFIWSNKRINERVPALNKISQDVFKEEIQQYLKDNPLIVIFAEQTLSPEDFAQRDQSGVIFSNLAKLAKSTKVSYLPYVQNPIRALKHLDVTVTEVPLDKFGKSFEFPETDILIVNLNDAKDSENRIDMLKRHDQAIADIYRDLAKRNKYVLAIYTAHHTSWVASEEIVKSRQARSLLQTDESAKKPEEPTETEVDKSVRAPEPIPSDGKFFNHTKVFFYLTNAVFTHEKVTKNITFSYTIDEVNSTTLVFAATGTSDTYTVDLQITFTNTSSHGYWSQQDPITAKVTKDNTSTDYTLTPTAQIYAPDGFSFHCGDQMFSANGFQIVMTDFQIELFFNERSKTGKFDDAYDCVGFTTVPIWSGLFVTTILLLIMTIGITMMMDIRTMDRFDDSKGKTITINAE